MVVTAIREVLVTPKTLKKLSISLESLMVASLSRLCNMSNNIHYVNLALFLNVTSDLRHSRVVDGDLHHDRAVRAFVLVQLELVSKSLISL
jgi:hypothetical protein